MLAGRHWIRNRRPTRRARGVELSFIVDVEIEIIVTLLRADPVGKGDRCRRLKNLGDAEFRGLSIVNIAGARRVGAAGGGNRGGGSASVAPLIVSG